MTAPWAGRAHHTSVIDAAGAIYVIGGHDSSTYLNDVWVSTDGGVRPHSRGDGRWVLEGVLQGYYRGYYRASLGRAQRV
jgi:hypothetical protein